MQSVRVWFNARTWFPDLKRGFDSVCRAETFERGPTRSISTTGSPVQ
jgi:hypothetical protein